MATVKEVTPPQAWKMLQDDPAAVLLDVRSRVEFDYVGHPPGAVHVPWQEAPEWRVDPGFVAKVRSRLAAVGEGRDPSALTVLTICRSGGRSRAAAQALQDAGFQRAYNVVEGFEGRLDEGKHRGTLDGWRFHGLPWEQT
jgi:rhodanese-related sulfurtransferase